LPSASGSSIYKASSPHHFIVFTQHNKHSNSQQPKQPPTKITYTQNTNNKQLPAMPFFKSSKSSKNQTASAATSPAQTPRSSMDQRAKPHQMPREEALETRIRRPRGHRALGPYVRFDTKRAKQHQPKGDPEQHI